MIAVDLFSGAGGSTLGIMAAGFKPVAAVDIDGWATTTYERNLGLTGVAVFKEDLRELSGEDLLSAIGLLPGELDLLVGCPPCQGFTDHGKPDDPRNSLILVFAERIREIRPVAVIFENVRGILRRGRPLFDRFVERLRRAGYRPAWSLLEAADYGVPQRRKRVILVALKRGLPKPVLPAPTHARPGLASKLGLLPWRTVRDAIADLPPLAPGEKYPHIPNHEAPAHSERVLKIIRMIPKDGGTIRDLPREYWLRCHLRHDGHKDVYGRMRWDAPAPTITTGVYTPSKGRFIHPEQDRGITMREAARLQGFPDWFVFEGPRVAQSRQIGNAMPPPLIEAVARSLADILVSVGAFCEEPRPTPVMACPVPIAR